jgi:hypothetical protein
MVCIMHVLSVRMGSFILNSSKKNLLLHKNLLKIIKIKEVE